MCRIGSKGTLPSASASEPVPGTDAVSATGPLSRSAPVARSSVCRWKTGVPPSRVSATTYMTPRFRSIAPVLRMPTSLAISPSGPYSNRAGTGSPRFTCHSMWTGDMASASKAYTLLCMVDRNTTFRVAPPETDNPLTISACEKTWPSTGKTPSLPNAVEVTVAGESWVSCKFELVRSLLPLAVSMLTCGWIEREKNTVTDTAFSDACKGPLQRSHNRLNRLLHMGPVQPDSRSGPPLFLQC